MTASIIVNTYNRARSLERLLPSLDHLDGVRFEVVVVNGPSTDDTDVVLARHADRLKVARCPTGANFVAALAEHRHRGGGGRRGGLHRRRCAARRCRVAA